jgi:hypothetical protein
MSAMLEINVTAREHGWHAERLDRDRIYYTRSQQALCVTYSGNWVVHVIALTRWGEPEARLTSRDRDKKKRILSFLTASVDSPIKVL